MPMAPAERVLPTSALSAETSMTTGLIGVYCSEVGPECREYVCTDHQGINNGLLNPEIVQFYCIMHNSLLYEPRPAQQYAIVHRLDQINARTQVRYVHAVSCGRMLRGDA